MTTDPHREAKIDALTRQMGALLDELGRLDAEHGTPEEQRLAARVSVWLARHPQRLELLVSELKRPESIERLRVLGYALAKLEPPAPAFVEPAAEPPRRAGGKRARKAAQATE